MEAIRLGSYQSMIPYHEPKRINGFQWLPQTRSKMVSTLVNEEIDYQALSCRPIFFFHQRPTIKTELQSLTFTWKPIKISCGNHFFLNPFLGPAAANVVDGGEP